nr:hypothetical transcript [Hymenolepis microstoma]
MKVKEMARNKKPKSNSPVKKLKKKSKDRNDSNAESQENNEDLELQISLLQEKREKLSNQSRNFASSQMNRDEVGMYQLECSKKDCLPISRYIRNINAPAFEMCYANIGPEEFLPLSLSLGRNTSIKKLDLSHNWLGDDGLYYLSQALYENNNFVEIILVNNKISSKMIEQLCDAVSVSPKLKFLNLSENRLDDSAAPFIADLMLTSPSLHTLNISKNRFSENSVAQIGRGIGETECLKVLDISWNHVVCSGKGMKRFSKGLAMSKLEVLNYSFNQIGPTNGCLALMRGLKANRYLKEIDLSDNLISVQGCEILSKALLTNKCLTKIMFARNPFQVEGCIEILNNVLMNRQSQLIEINFEDISGNQDFKKLVDQAFDFLPNLKIVYGSRLSLSDQEVFSLKIFAPRDNSPRRWLIALHKLQQKFNRPLMPFLLEADRDNDMKLSRIELTEALELYCKPLGISLIPELQALLNEIDPSNTNEVQISDFSQNPFFEADSSSLK